MVFSGKSFTQCPLTIDHAVVKNLFTGIKSSMIRGTAPPSGTQSRYSHHQDSKAVSKVIILLLMGSIIRARSDPLTAMK